MEGLKTVTTEEPDSYSICLQDFEMAAPVLAMPCSHLFHAARLKNWLERSGAVHALSAAFRFLKNNNNSTAQ
ncbi:hypothetical protein ZIOFF_003234 [Zingiber officinale]|uniref:RING-type domain-containing protein n=1 Tax=Zingiber officinale TaxID=94328 RepID=A0A8J5I922_ZINOF|nr:hypothetical protein ZIOFF_003234 [Zingiber officinale]